MVSVDVGTRECDGQVVVALRGELDLVDAASVAVALTAAAAREREIIVDLAGLEFIDCSGVAALVRARKQARHAGGDLLLAAPQQQVLRLLTLTRLIDVFSVHASVDEATGSADRSRRMAAPVAGRPVRPAHGDVQAGSGGRGPQPGGPAVRGRRARCHTLRRRACRLGRTYLAPASQSAADLGTPTNPHPLIVPVGQAGASRPDRDKRAAGCHGDKAATRGHRACICRCSSASTPSALASGPAWPAGSRASSTSASKRPSSHARASSARRANRRSQPRPVSDGAPIREAITDHGTPPEACTSAAPITSTPYWRRRSIVSGSRTRVLPHDPQIERGGSTSSATPSSPTISRDTPYHQGANTLCRSNNRLSG